MADRAWSELIDEGRRLVNQEGNLRWQWGSELAGVERRLSGSAWWELWHRVGEPADIDARDVPCRLCGARAGVYCRRPSGHKAMSAHAVRWDDALFAYDVQLPLE